MDSKSRKFKQQAHELIERRLDGAGWKNLSHEASVLQDIEEALRNSDADRGVDNDQVRRFFGFAD